MIKNYFLTAWRNLLKSRLHSFINITGLSVGMAVAILIALWIHDERSFDKNFANYNRIAKVIQNVTNNGEVQTWTSIPYPLAEEIRKNYGSDFKRVILSSQLSDHTMNYENKRVTANGAFFEKGIADMLSLPMKEGQHNGLDDPSSIFISASLAKAYFGKEPALNKMIQVDDNPVTKVAGVYKDFPANSSFKGIDFIGNWDFLYNNSPGMKNMEDPWRPNAFNLLVELNDNADFTAASFHIKDAKLKKVNPQLAKKKPALFLQPMSRWHLYSEFKNGVNVGGAIQYVWMFAIIGIFVLLLACINFMNLSTARSENRAKEVGIRKTVGSLRKQLVFQFFQESLLTVVIAFALAIGLVQLTIRFFNQVAGKQMSILWGEPLFWLSTLAFVLLTALVAGSYPALYLSSFKPIKVLKGTFRAGRLAVIPRKVLVILQFAVSVILITGTITVYQQIQYAKDRPVGYTRNGLVTIPLFTSAIHDHFNAVRDELTQKGAILSMAEAGSPTTDIWSSTSGLTWKGKDPNLSVDFGSVSVSYEYGKTVGWEFKQGRDFSRAFATDSSSMILNEAAVQFMGLKNPVGETVTWWGTPFTVVGVIHNMIMTSPYDEPKPTVFTIANDGGVAILKLNPQTGVQTALTTIENLFKKTNPTQPYTYSFVDEEYAKKFGDEVRVAKLAGFFAVLAVLISCLGLFGLMSFIAEQRRKEIGIRKVLGASVMNVWGLLSRDFLFLVVIAFFMAVPVSYYYMHNWLEHYNYRTSLSWWIFAMAGLGALGITLIVVSFQAIRAAVANPVRSLRTE